MQVYIYAADIYCGDCGEAIREEITQRGFAPDSPVDEGSYDSDEFPKGPYCDGGGEADCPQHCGAEEDCINAIEFPDGSRIGVWLENELTAGGVEYVKRAVKHRREAGWEVANLWAEYYSDYDL